MRNDIALLLQAQQRQTELQRRATTLTDGLLSALGIAPHGHEWVCWLADSRVRDNREAVRVWVLQQLSLGLDTGSSELSALSQRLVLKLHAVQESLT
ncbi:MAG: hypothetical protein ACREP9_14490 [Candidatus Dormibacteraceae bacterium]